MSTAAALTLASFCIAVLVAALAAAIVVGRSLRQSRETRRLRTTAPERRVLIELLAEEDPGCRAVLVGMLLDLRPRTWRAVEPTVVEMLGKVTGDAHAALRELVEVRGSVGRARRRVGGLGAVTRARSAELLGSLGDPVVTEDLVALLRDRDPEVRQVAARALGRSGDPRAARPLLRCLRGGAVPARVVSQALLRLGPGAHHALVEGLDEPDELVRAVAVEILGLSSAIVASRAVERALREDPSLEVRIRAARALGRVGLPSSLPALLEVTTHDAPTPLRVVGARALGDLGHPGAVPALRRLVADPVHRVAANAARSLGVLGAEGRAALEQLEQLGRELEAPAARHADEALARLRLTGPSPLAARATLVRGA